MTKLSPAAKAILEAYDNSPWEYDTGDLTACAAVLRAVADQVVPPAVILEYYERNESPVLGKAIEVRNKLLAIAAELRGTTTTETP